MSNRSVRLRLEGSVEKPVEFSYQDLDSLCASCKPTDLTKLVKDLTGEAVWLKAVLKQAKTLPSAASLTFHSSDGSSRSMPMDETTDSFILYKKDDKPLSEELGGPLCLFLPKVRSDNTIMRLEQIEIKN